MYIVLEEQPDDGLIIVTLPMPADRRTSFSGSGLPFPREDIAFGDDVESRRSGRTETLYSRPDSDILHLNSLSAPNWYYRNGVYGPPHARVAYAVDGRPVIRSVPVHDVPRVAGRSLTANAIGVREAPSPPARAKIVETQYEALRRRGMPGTAC